jgi:hypothetical protein
MNLPHNHPSSYRDPSGFVFFKNGILYRQINKVFKNDFDFFIDSGLYTHLVDKRLLVSHQTVSENLTGSQDCYVILKPEFIPFISYPYEWCFDMLKEAALLTLEAAKEALNYKMMLKDASAYNVQLYRGKLIFIDTLSFERYDEQKPWIAYRQFCEHFFAPLALMHYLKEPLQNLFIAYPDGIPLNIASKLLPFKSRLNLHSYLHLHLQNFLPKKMRAKDEKSKSFSKKKMENLLQSLEQAIQSFSFSPARTAWSNYYTEANQRGDYVSAKKQIIGDWIKTLNVNTILDAGANEGEFSELAANLSTYVISTDSDRSSIRSLYKRVKQKNIPNICPLVMDLSSPSPAMGFNNKEWLPFFERAKVDVILALALIHHLVLLKNIPFDKIAEMFSSIGRYLIIEFVPKEDEKVQLLIQQKENKCHDYTREAFTKSFSQYFSVMDQRNIGGSKRTLYLLKRKETCLCTEKT